ncbi:MAG: hypothetical protein J0G99_09480 [Alphaproteobacteria bacterium]|nr:hypothetical protein [Alphaproteobacteria bacterium]
MKIPIAVVALLAGVASAAAQAPPPRAQDCLRIANIYDYTPVPGNRALIVTDRARHKFKLTFMGRCTGLQYHVGLAFKSYGTGGLSCLSRGDKVITHDVAGPPECLISSVVPYTPEMEKADAEAAAKAKAARP